MAIFFAHVLEPTLAILANLYETLYYCRNILDGTSESCRRFFIMRAIKRLCSETAD